MLCILPFLRSASTVLGYKMQYNYIVDDVYIYENYKYIAYLNANN